jgi:hypothetical protein
MGFLIKVASSANSNEDIKYHRNLMRYDPGLGQENIEEIRPSFNVQFREW